ncbi:MULTISPECIES: efflux RND transporter permease subunit [unclassified Bosea (in: a-proteobacteria)]|uniref:efflux RND transporter permease subunit n=1 Tax=unclassified Bosea (in: a-proteobacteria) TaxID=2653178 RepID=UPI000F75EBAA|nr:MULTISPECIES: efflux RND transporter permease subunit [unclassified Bosea (in: a-proteobacteria)]AZO80049.1 multidrug transporter AcrB [Bosea sp. Tri-49]RXT22832.1 multidrug transporter AcrB [Bosea sp. Tri-39]RXT38301.1 multidrug transporter AcrB [Bosea sp. Tri-54]
MSLFELFVRRPVLSTVLSLLVILIGFVSYTRLTVREYPNIDEPIVSVQTVYRGASAEIIETQVTQILENSIAGIEGIEIINSTSRQERSQISVRFRPDVDPDVAASDVRDRVSRVRGRMPDEIDEPIIAKVEADAQPVMYLSLTSSRHSPLELTDFADRFIADRVQNITGVAEVRILGQRQYAMRIWLDRARLAAYNITVQEIEAALRAQNVEIPSGRIESDSREFTVLSQTSLNTPEQFREITVKDANGFPVKLRDIAKVELGAREERNAAWFGGQPSVTIGIVKQATANPLDVSSGVVAALPGIREDLPDGMSIATSYDTSIFIDRSIKAVYTTIGEAVVLVVLIIFLFLRSLRATLIPLVTIPVSLIGAFALMYALGFTVNTLTLLSMVLAIGLVVDDAIVVLENVHRHIEDGVEPTKAAIKGINEIAFAVVAMTLTLVAVYAPMAFSTGRTGKLFVEFALTLAGAVLVSGFVALTLTPMMCAKLLKHHDKHNWLYNILERFFEALSSGYRRSLRFALSVRPVVVLLALLVAGGSYFFFTNLRSELAPVEDRGTITAIGVAPEGATMAFTADYARRVEDYFSKIQEVDSYLVIVGFPDVTRAIAFARLKPWEERHRKQQDLVAEINKGLSQIPGIRLFATNPPSLGQGGANSKPVEFVLRSSDPYVTIKENVDRLIAEVQGNPALTNIETNLILDKPQIKVSIDRQRASDLGVGVDVIGRTMETLLGGRQVTRFNMNGEQYDVMLQVAGAERSTPQALQSIYLMGRGGQAVQLSSLVQIEENVAPKELIRFNQLRSATITAVPGAGYSLGDALAVLEQGAAKVLPASFQTDYSGQSREFKQSGSSILLVFLLALGFIYLVLAAQFESFVDPVVIMVSVPLSLTGALAALYFSGGTLNVYSQIGLITLVGLITKHGILILEFTNQLREEGHEMIDALVDAAELRLRPILMTTGAMVLGAVPLALAEGAGAESRSQIGWVIVGGMTFGTLLTLYVVPVAYSYMARTKHGSRHASAEAHPQPAE